MIEGDVREVRFRLDRRERKVGLVVMALVAAAAIFHRVEVAHRALLLSAALDGATLASGVDVFASDPRPHRRLGLLSLYHPGALDAQRAVDHFRRAARLSPFDFESWTLLAQAYDAAGQPEAAERAYGKARERAPAYFFPRWLYANFLLRQGAPSRALSEFVRAIEAHPLAAEGFCELIWQASPTAAADLLAVAHRLHASRAQQIIGEYLTARGQTREALQLWDVLPGHTPGTDRFARVLVSELIRQGRLLLAARVWCDRMRRKGYSVGERDERFWNGGFEYDLDTSAFDEGTQEWRGFDWQIESTSAVRADIVEEAEAAEGRRALKLTFLANDQVKFSGVSHDLAVSPGMRYLVRFRYRTKQMTAPTGLLVEIGEGQSSGTTSVLARSRSLPPSGGWTAVVLPFQAPTTANMVVVRIARRPLGPLHDFIAGSAWFDDFVLEPISFSDPSDSSCIEATARVR